MYVLFIVLIVSVIQTESFLLPPVRVQDKNKKCVVIDLDETLVHSSFTVSHVGCC